MAADEERIQSFFTQVQFDPEFSSFFFCFVLFYCRDVHIHLIQLSHIRPVERWMDGCGALQYSKLLCELFMPVFSTNSPTTFYCRRKKKKSEKCLFLVEKK